LTSGLCLVLGGMALIVFLVIARKRQKS
jgi:hypothetical protein